MDMLLSLLVRHDRLFAAIGWTCFALSCAIHARFVSLPDWAAIPFWVGVGLMVARWAMLEPMRERLLARAKADGDGR
ncbi:hypothetical protein [Sphingomicrobium astaxanthinifaciens]|uniref:hypothetical protein n=1 Tax=Sphingomicrobium astaxanthinifaciens TaxID=1227949 RepID=UPI001FCCAE7A|nr:hypothetical protein [Sphingomicrobium astaxanthinifaciens]MCJ7421978.1 hypothetical protein [Sphingomicrobium astaxanthinifaciens]